jgi:MmyB-like transcription regulator ligand binding domain/Helix-turn-helix domain
MTANEDRNRARRLPARARRGLVTPQQADISADYYLRLERGRDNRPPPQVLDALARLLLLDEVECDYLHSLATSRPRRRRPRTAEQVPARLHHLLADVGVPAFVEGGAFDVLAANELATTFSPRLRPGENRLRSLLLAPEEQAFHQDWTAAASGFVAALRDSIGTDVDDLRFVELVGELSLTSGRFRELWARHDVRALEGSTTTVNHPVLGRLRLHRDKLPVDGLLLMLYYADAGRRTSHATIAA